MPRAVTIRDVATEAHVTTGLVHHYFESKDTLLVATVRSIATDIEQEARLTLEETGDVSEMVRTVWQFCERRPAFRSIVMWWALDGRDVTKAMGNHPFIRTLAGALGAPSDPDAPTQTGLIVTLILAGHLASGVNRAIGREPRDPAISNELLRLLLAAAKGEGARSEDGQVNT